ncbi:uracil-DNA glycosylase [Anaerolineae bacterium CFX9]|nr:uracil-DNA glycosylase [Anaerolineae bacterium CFX9]
MTEERAIKLVEIVRQIKGCTLCGLHRGRTHAVPGAGDTTSPILFIGEGPGFNEDKQGLPFVGRSGDLLVKLLRSIGLTRDQVFITNVVKCRPPENRDPLPEEIAACKPYLDRQIELIDPLVIVTLGRFSMARYFPGGKITQIHGKPKFDDRRAYLPLFHPAAVLRSPSLEPAMQTDFNKIPLLVEEMRKRRRAALPPADSASNEDGTPTQLSLF